MKNLAFPSSRFKSMIEMCQNSKASDILKHSSRFHQNRGKSYKMSSKSTKSFEKSQENQFFPSTRFKLLIPNFVNSQLDKIHLNCLKSLNIFTQNISKHFQIFRDFPTNNMNHGTVPPLVLPLATYLHIGIMQIRVQHQHPIR